MDGNKIRGDASEKGGRELEVEISVCKGKRSRMTCCNASGTAVIIHSNKIQSEAF